MRNPKVFQTMIVLFLALQTLSAGCGSMRNHESNVESVTKPKRSGPLKVGMTSAEARKAIGVLWSDGMWGTLGWYEESFKCIRYPFSMVDLYFELDEDGIYRLQDWEIGKSKKE